MRSNFSNLDYGLKPREKLILFGGENLSDAELLSIILQTGSKGKSVNILANTLLEKYGSLKKVMGQPLGELISNDGIGEVKAIKIKVIYYINERVKNQWEQNPKVSCAQDIYNLVKVYENNTEENFYIISLKNNNEILGIKHLFKGGIDSVTIHLREIFREAFLLNARSICLIHNHPSGSLAPSVPDINITKSIITSSKLIGIKVLDHIIIGNGKYISLNEAGIIEFF